MGCKRGSIRNCKAELSVSPVCDVGLTYFAVLSWERNMDFLAQELVDMVTNWQDDRARQSDDGKKILHSQSTRVPKQSNASILKSVSLAGSSGRTFILTGHQCAIVDEWRISVIEGRKKVEYTM